MSAKPLDILADWLRWYHRDYTVDDVVLSSVPGYLVCTKPCPWAGKWWLCGPQEHYHTLYIGGVGYPDRDERGRWVSPYKLWRELHGVLKEQAR